MKRSFIITLFVLISCQEKQFEMSILNDCLSIEQADLLNNMIFSFEDDLCKYYSLSKNKSDKAIKEYLNEMQESDDSSFLLNIASNKSKKLLKESFTILSNDVWITYKEEYSPDKELNIYVEESNKRIISEIDTVGIKVIHDTFLEDDIPILENGENLKSRLANDKIEKEELMKKHKNKHFLRIYGKLVDCTYKKTINDSARKLYEALSISGRISSLLFINGLLDLNTKDFNSKEVRTYIALDLFYSPLDFELK